MSLSFSSSPTICTSVRIPLTNVSRPTLLSPKTHRARPSETRFDSSTRSDGFGSTLRWISGSPGLTRNRGRSMGVRCEARDDGYYMRRAVELARKALGHTSPNPMVGCVIVRDGEIVGEGFHPKAGQPHGEVFALRDAGDLAENATAYVSLEPCNHYGRTPPCTEALIRAKVKRVVVGMVDPNPIVASKGVERLRESGIDVLVGVEELLCRRLNEAYIHRMIAGKPFVTVRYSLSFSGKILNHLGNGAEEPGGYYSQLLQEYDGIVISSNSLVEPFTFPTSNEVGSNQPLQIIISRTVDSSLCLPTSTMQSSSQIVVLTEKATSLEPELKGTKIVVLEKMNFVSILDYCASKGLCSILLDFRGHDDILTGLLEEGLKEHLVQKLMMEVCPVWDRSDETSILAFGGDKLRLRDLQSRISKESIVVEGYLL